jgi:hypothetical protein
MAEILKEAANLSLGAGSIVALVFVIFKQMELIKEFKVSLDVNNKLTEALTEKMQRSIEVDQEVTAVMRSCKLKSRHP